MDDIVIKAMAKWPNVPHCFGWLGLDGRGFWYLRDQVAQATWSFAHQGLDGVPDRASKGSKLTHEKLIGFIERNYMADDIGQWYFQNGPQRVYVELEHAPWVWRIESVHAPVIVSHTGLFTQADAALVDERGLLYLHTALGLGLVHSQDMDLAAELLDAGQWPLESVLRCDLPERFGYVLSPQAFVTAATGV